MPTLSSLFPPITRDLADPCIEIGRVRLDHAPAPPDPRLSMLRRRAAEALWDAAVQFDWATPMDPANPAGAPPETSALYGSPYWRDLTPAQRAALQVRSQAWQWSQQLHFEQLLIAHAGRLQREADDLEVKKMAAVSAAASAAHMDALEALLRRYDVAYPMVLPMRRLAARVEAEPDWRRAMLAMDVLGRHMALANLTNLRDLSTNALARQIAACLMADLSLHAEWARLRLRAEIPQLTPPERAAREALALELLTLMHDEMVGTAEVSASIGLAVGPELRRAILSAVVVGMYRALVFQRIVPVLRDLTLWSPDMRAALGRWDALEHAGLDLETFPASDARWAREIAREARNRTRCAR